MNRHGEEHTRLLDRLKEAVPAIPESADPSIRRLSRVIAPAAVLLAGAEVLFGFAANEFLQRLSSTVAEESTTSIAACSFFFVSALLARALFQWFSTAAPIVIGDRAAFRARERATSDAAKAANSSTESGVRTFHHDAEKTAVAARAAAGFHRDVVVIVFLLAGALLLSWKLSLCVFAAVALSSFPIRFIRSYTIASTRASQLRWTQASEGFVRLARNLVFLKVCGTVERERESVERSLALACDAQIRLRYTQGLGYAYLQICAGVTVLTVGLAVPHLEVSSWFTPIGYIYIIGRLLDRAMSGYTNYFDYVSNRVFLRDETDDREESKDTASPENPLRTAVLEAPLGWEVEGISFTYPEQPNLFRDVSCSIPPGAFTVIHGPSGSGKSTFLRLLLGLAAPESGTIEVSSSAESFSMPSGLESLSPGIAYLSTDAYLVPGSVRENLLYGLDREPDHEEIERALVQAQCGFVERLPRRLDEPVDDTLSLLSTGELQRLSFARALLRRPRAIVIDEGTSNLDPDNEAWILERLRMLSGSTTVVFVSHRSVTQTFADVELEFERTASGSVGVTQRDAPGTAARPT